MNNTDADRYLAIRISGETYGIPVLRVREITKPVPTNRIFGSPKGTVGIFNWRGGTIPVIDVGTRLGLMSSVGEQESKFVVVDYAGRNMERCSSLMGCGKEQCPGHTSDDRFCWAVAGTHCRGEIQGSYHVKIDACRNCRFFRAAYDQGLVKQAALVVDAVETVTALERETEADLRQTVGTDSNLVTGLARQGERLVFVLNVDRLVHVEVPAACFAFAD